MLDYFVFHFSDLKHSGHRCLGSDEQKLPKCTVLFPAPYSVTSWFRCRGQTILFSWLHQPSWVQLLSSVLRLRPARCWVLFVILTGLEHPVRTLLHQPMTDVCHTFVFKMGHQRASFPLPCPDPSNTVWLIQPDVIWCAQEERLQDKSLHVGASGEERLRKCFEGLKKKKKTKNWI